MNDMLGVEIKPNDIILYNNYVAVVLKSYSNSIKYTIDGNYISTTGKYDAILNLSNFNIDNIENKKELISSNIISNNDSKEINIEQDIKIKKRLEELRKLKRNVKPGDILFSANNQMYYYLGKHDKSNYYLNLGWFYQSIENNNEIDSQIENSVKNRNFIHCNKIKSKKSPNAVVTTLRKKLKNILLDKSEETFRIYYNDIKYQTIIDLLNKI